LALSLTEIIDNKFAGDKRLTENIFL